MGDINIEIAGSDRPLMAFDVVISECSSIQRDLYPFGLAWIEVDFGEALQFLHRARNTRVLIADINLCNFCAGPSTRVRDVESQSDGLIRRPRLG